MKKSILTALILSGSLGFGSGLVLAQGTSGTKGAGGAPEKGQPPTGQTKQEPATPGSKVTASADEIKKAEEALKAQGLNPGPVDGKMDNQTEQALREFQKKNKLAVTGSLDQQTADKLGVKLGAAKGPSSQQPGSSTPQSTGPAPQTK
jgi:peptidoglycan hydrolase-like protein with peptidoglycan-binding domain